MNPRINNPLMRNKIPPWNLVIGPSSQVESMIVAKTEPVTSWVKKLTLDARSNVHDDDLRLSGVKLTM